MTGTKRIGIWMDHSKARLIEYSAHPEKVTTTLSSFTHEVKEAAIQKGEHSMHQKEQHQQAAYYKKLEESIKKYDEVLLFGPSDAKMELYNRMQEDHLFSDIKIEVKQSDKLTENQQDAFVKNYFKTAI